MRAVKETVRKYYKYDTTNPQYNYTPIGTLTNTDGVLSGFSSSNKASIGTFNPSVNSYELVLKFKTSSLSTRYDICGAASTTTTSNVPQVRITSSKVNFYGPAYTGIKS